MSFPLSVSMSACCSFHVSVSVSVSVSMLHRFLIKVSVLGFMFQSLGKIYVVFVELLDNRSMLVMYFLDIQLNIM